MTAQKKDLSEPDVINEFAALVRDQSHLDYLYVLTVADVRGTNPKLWNSWKATLFRDLYELTTQALRRGLENPIDRELLIGETQVAARQQLAAMTISSDDVDDVWQMFNEDYFLRYRSDEIAWHTQILAAASERESLLDLRKQPDGDGVEAFLYTPRAKRSFAHATALLDELGMNIVDVRIVPISNGYSLDTYIFMELDRRTDIDSARLEKIHRLLSKILTTEDADDAIVTRPAPRQVRMFATTTVINFARDPGGRRTIMSLVAADQPGLLNIVGRAFSELNIDIEMAKIVTIGERAEDVFYILGADGKPLSDNACRQLQDKLVKRIENRD
jgi:[protein-PII] uridylyltransferase